MTSFELPLFPLGTVLLPGSRLGLRLFEPRYLDLVKRCGRDGSSFGICLIAEGNEAGLPATPVAIGTEARIVDFAMTDDGLLGITVEGGRRFRWNSRRVQPDGLQLAEVDWLPADPEVRLRPEHGLLATLLARILEQVDRHGDGHAGAGDRQAQLQRADWVAWRLAEWLPLSAGQRLALLAEDDPHERLQQLTGILAELQPD